MPGVIVPQRRNRDAELLGIIQTGMNIAQTVYGIKAANDEAERKAAADARSAELFDIQKQQAQDQIAGNVTGKDLIGRSYREAKGPEVGAVGLRTPEGLKYVVVDPLTAAEQATLQVNKDNANLKRIEEQRKISREDAQDVYDVKMDFKKDGVVQKNGEMLQRANNVIELLAQGTPSADNMAINQSVKASGDTGAITAADREAFGVTGGMLERFEAYINRQFDGDVLNERARRDITTVMKAIAASSTRKINDQAKFYAESGAKRVRGMNVQDFLEELNADLVIGSLPPVDDVPIANQPSSQLPMGQVQFPYINLSGEAQAESYTPSQNPDPNLRILENLNKKMRGGQ